MRRTALACAGGVLDRLPVERDGVVRLGRRRRWGRHVMGEELVQAGLGVVAVGRQLACREQLRRLLKVAVREG
eukprot:12910425-Prorocentrum_lima.AAC.1